MDRFDAEVNREIKDSLANIKLSPFQKEKLKHKLNRELKLCQQPWWRRVNARLAEFWETTFEINLAPVAALTVAVAVMIGAAGLAWETQPVSHKHQVVYIQQTTAGPDGTIQMVFVPVNSREGN